MAAEKQFRKLVKLFESAAAFSKRDAGADAHLTRVLGAVTPLGVLPRDAGIDFESSLLARHRGLVQLFVLAIAIVADGAGVDPYLWWLIALIDRVRDRFGAVQARFE